MKDASHYITVLWVARSLYLFPKLQSRRGIIKVNTDVSIKNPYDVPKITSVAMLNKMNSSMNQNGVHVIALEPFLSHQT